MTEENNILYFIGEEKALIQKEYVEYLYSNQINLKNIMMCEYLGLFCRMHDVVRITDLNTKATKYVAPGDEYEPYYYNLKYPGSTYPWRDEEGSLSYIYNAFENRGLKLYTTMYKEIRENQKTYKLK